MTTTKTTEAIVIKPDNDGFDHPVFSVWHRRDNGTEGLVSCKHVYNVAFNYAKYKAQLRHIPIEIHPDCFDHL